MFVAFSIFILACGVTHALDVWTTWNPDYWQLGIAKAITAGASVPTAILLVYLVPKALLIPSTQQMAKVNAELQKEINERKRIDAELQKRNSELERTSQFKSEFLANMSHELRTPLNAIIGFSEVLKDGLFGNLSARQNTYISQIFSSGQHLLALINDILDISKIEAGKMTLDMEKIAVNAVLRPYLDIFKEKAGERGIRLDYDACPGDDSIVIDARKLKQIVYNLLANAVKFTHNGGEVKLSARAVKRNQLQLAAPQGMATRLLPLPPSNFQDFLEIRVIDSGIGIEREDIFRLFQPFQQLDSSLTRQHEGTGLGLSLVSRLAQLHGGAVGIASAPEQGSHFVVWLPWRTDADHEITNDNSTEIITAPAKSRLARQALVIEDDESAAELLRFHLESFGFQVSCAPDAASAISLAAQQPPDLITLDLLLPDTSGWELLDQIRDIPELDAVPIVIISILAEEEKGFAIGITKMLQKPVARKTLLDAIYSLGLADETTANMPTVLIIDDDPQAIELVKAHLEGQDYNILCATDGYSALHMAHQMQPDLIILDLMLPDISGFEVIEALVHHPASRLMPILVLTAKTITRQDRERLQGHVMKIIEKDGFNHQQFLTEVKRALREN